MGRKEAAGRKGGGERSGTKETFSVEYMVGGDAKEGEFEYEGN